MVSFGGFMVDFLPETGPFAFPLFNREPQLLAAALNSPALNRGMKGPGIALVQTSLSILGYQNLLPITFRTGKPDGSYGKETDKAVRAFQTDQLLRVDGDAGKYTLAALDRCLSGWPTPKKPAPPKSIPPKPIKSTHYEIGTGDLKIKHDFRPLGAPSKAVTQEQMDELHTYMQRFARAAWVKMPLASKHLRHYFGGSGRTVELDVSAIVHGAGSARGVYSRELAQARKFCEMLPVGKHSIRSRKPESTSFEKDQERNYFYAIGGYAYWGTGTVEITEVAGKKNYDLEFRFVMKDYYNWNPNQGVDLPGVKFPSGRVLWPEIPVKDRLMDEFRRRGMAKEFHMKGSTTSKWSWTEGDPPGRFKDNSKPLPLVLDGPGMTPLH